MSGRASAARYARALLEVAIKESDPERVGQQLASFADLVGGNAELRGTLTNPVIPVPGKRRLTEGLVARLELTPPVSKLLLMLADRDRFSLLPDLLDVYRERLEEYLQVVRAEVTTAMPLPADDAVRLKDRLAAATGRRVTLTTKVDPALIGGMVARIGSTVYDGSVATQLERMRTTLLDQS
jgi:F-type H+-transporting ATPase subunit delta